MVVDDEALVSAFLRELLEDMGYVVDTFANGPEALSALGTTSEPYAALITDLTMPLMTGLELASIVSSRVPSLPIVLCTGASEPPVADALLRAGIRRVLPKPVPVAELKDVLAELLRT
jgi:CheY-like chemotaxis protein